LKWETRYVASEDFGAITRVSEKTMGACLKAAKAYSAKHSVRLHLNIEKVAVSGSVHFGTVNPGKCVVGEWRFSGMARC
jgi:hypothetical protein